MKKKVCIAGFAALMLFLSAYSAAFAQKAEISESSGFPSPFRLYQLSGLDQTISAIQGNLFENIKILSQSLRFEHRRFTGYFKRPMVWNRISHLVQPFEFTNPPTRPGMLYERNTPFQEGPRNNAYVLGIKFYFTEFSFDNVFQSVFRNGKGTDRRCSKSISSASLFLDLPGL